jgi:hypothetical protein
MAFALVPACGSDSGETEKRDAAADVVTAKDTLVADAAPDGATGKDALAADVAPDQGETQSAPDLAADPAPGDAPGAELRAVETGAPDQPPTEAGGVDVTAVVDLARDLGRGPEAQADGAKPDSALPDAAPDTAGEGGAPLSYTCRDDADCCIKVDTCMARAYLYSKAPGASPAPTIPTVTDPGQCLRCITPGVQVRCDNGQCVGQQLSGYSSLAQDHCGTIVFPDGGSASDQYFPRAYAGAQPVSWGC